MPAEASALFPKSAVYSAPALEKGLDILECFTQGSEVKTLQELSAALGRSSSEIYRMVEVLAKRGYLTRQGNSYRLSLKLFELGKQLLPQRDLTRAATLPMHEVAQLTRQSVHLSVHHNRRLVVVISVATPEPLGFGVRLGSHFPFRTDRTSARVITAFQPPEMKDFLIRELLENTPGLAVDEKALRQRLMDLQARGYEQSRSDTVLGITDIAFPIFDGAQPGAVASINMPYLKQRDAAMTVPQVRAALKKTAQAISRHLGGMEGL
jgi:DNA-binding IclR family transcriptional regulator